MHDTHDIEQLRWFQMRRYYETGLLDEMPVELPDDPAVASSAYFGVYSPTGEIEASTRLIMPHAELPLLGFELFPAAVESLFARRDKVAEVSRLAVARNTPRHRALGLLSRELFRYCLLHQEANALIASIETPLIRILERVLGIPVEVIGPEITKYPTFNGACVPVLIDTIRYLEEARWRNHERWAFFTEGLVIDLTDTRPEIDMGTDDDTTLARVV